MQATGIVHSISHTARTIWRERPRFFTNPIILRELITQLRRKQSFFYLFVFIAVGAITFTSWWSSFLKNPGIYYGGGIDRQAQTLLLMLSLIEGIILLLFTPLMSATAINLEKERETWDLLQTTPVSLASIILGKFLKSIFFVWIVMLSMIPIFSLTMPVGGVSPQEIILIYAAFTEAIIILSLIGIYCSARWKRTLQSISFTYIIGFIYFFVIPLAPVFFLRGVGPRIPEVFPMLFSPMLVVIYGSLAPGELGQTFRMNDWQVLQWHYLLSGMVIAFLMVLCIFQMLPVLRKRLAERFNRHLMILGRCCGNPYILAILTLLGFGLFYNIQFFNQSANHIHFFIRRQNGLFMQFMINIGMLLLCLFPFSSTAYYQSIWNNQSWQEVSSTPKRLRQFLVQQLKQPFLIYLKWMTVLSPLFIAFFFSNPIFISRAIWSLNFLVEAVLMIAAIGLACSLMTRSLFQSIAYSYGLCAFFFLFVPTVLGKFHEYFAPACNPFLLASFPFDRVGWRNPFIVLQYSDNIGFVVTNLMYLIVFFVLILMFCERRVLKIAGKFESESLLKWFRRTLRNQTPNVDNPESTELHHFSERWNIVTSKELRELIVHKRTSFTKNLIWLFLLSAFAFNVLPVLSHDFYQGFLRYGVEGPLLVLTVFLPFFAIPYAANSFRKEHDQNTWEVLSTTTLSPAQLLHGKLWASFALFNLRFLAIVLPVVFLMYCLNWFGGKSDQLTYDYFLTGLSVYFPFILLMISLATCISLRVKNTTTAYITALLIAYFLIAFPIFQEIVGNRSRELSSIISPVFLLEGYNGSRNYWFPAYMTQICMNLFFAVFFYFVSYYYVRKSVNWG